MDVKIGLCNCKPPCGRISSTGWYCQADKCMHLTRYSLEDFIDILLNHEAIHKVIHEEEGLTITKCYNYIFDIKREIAPNKLSRENCLKTLREDGTPNFSFKHRFKYKIKRLRKWRKRKE